MTTKPGKTPTAGAVGCAGLRLPLLALLAVLLLLGVLAALALWPGTAPEWRTAIPTLQLCLVAAAAALLLLLNARVRHHLLEPLAHLREWARRMRSGKLRAPVPELPAGEFAALAEDINGLGEMMSSTSLEMEARVQKATRRIAQKTRSLEILCDVAATINTSRDLDQLLKKFLEIVSEVVEARGGVVRLLTGDGHLRLVASEGLDEEVVGRERLVAVDQCACGRAVSERSLQYHDARLCSEALGRPMFGNDDDDLEMMAVPLTYRGRVLGIYNLFVERPLPFPREDLNDLLRNIGRHLGMAIEKARLDDEAKRLSVMEERTLLAHELHDSLAQTLSSLRFQVRTLDDTLQAGDQPAALYSTARIANSLDEAYRELRELLAQFRAPMDQDGLVHAIRRVVDGFSRDNAGAIFFQQEWHDAELPVSMEMQILRIVQESLANVRKHGQAQHVRVILHHDEAKDTGWVLVEDDGVGFSQTDITGRPGEHLGLSIMEDRARRLGGKLKIESEAGEGTRVMLTFPLPGCAQAAIRAAV